MDSLRWILLALGILVLAGIYFFSRPRSGNTNPGRPRRKTPVMFAEGVDVADDHEGEPSISLDDPDDDEADGEESGDVAVNRDPDSIVALYLVPRDPMTRADVFRAARNAGLEYGDLEIFHRLHETEDGKAAVFSIANITKPGGFGSDEADRTPVKGLCVFLTLPNPLSSLDAWDAMLATTRRIADLLHCEIEDEAHSTLTRQRVASVREEMREYDRKRNLFQ